MTARKLNLEKLEQQEQKLKDDLKKIRDRKRAAKRQQSKAERNARTRHLVVLGSAFEKAGIADKVNYDIVMGLVSEWKKQIDFGDKSQLSKYEQIGKKLNGSSE